MLKNKDFEMISPCGIYCADCSVFKVKDNPELMPLLLANGLKAEQLPCPGCRAVDGNCPHLPERCDHYACAEKHEVDMCFQCDVFPCNKLHPATDRANVLPHNMKMYSQCFIQRFGAKEWIKQLPTIRKRYFTGKITYGRGPLLEDEVR
ncbi:MAG: DUF3795 domain-containing protein [Candidatus Cloacimonadaceae bacterium]|nr:DUF3795 domain-containing protein [Candidatus Cloacimonadaceae bacterium]